MKRRCLYHWMGHPDLDREVAIVRARVPGVPERLAAEAAAFVEALRELASQRPPGVAETIDWTQALVALGQAELDADVVDATLGTVLKHHEDIELVRDRGLPKLIAEASGAPMLSAPTRATSATRRAQGRSRSAAYCARRGWRSAQDGCRTACAGSTRSGSTPRRRLPRAAGDDRHAA